VPYDDGNTPIVGDRVRHTSGTTGTVYSVQLNAGNTPGHDQVAVKWDKGSSAMHIADECTLISRAQTSVEEGKQL